MRLLFVIRLYSGFASSIESRVWRPQGVPTIYKLIESAQTKSAGDTVIALTRKDFADTAPDLHGLEVVGLTAEVHVLAGPAAIPGLFGPLRWYLSELRQAWLTWRLSRRLQPDIVYVDRGNLWSAALLSRLTRSKVVYRMMGVSAGVQRSLNSAHPRQLLHRWFLRSPFAHVICSQDGSGGEQWLDRLLAPGVPRTMLLNGVDIDPPDDDAAGTGAADAAPDGTLVCFVGRLEEDKGGVEFIQAFIAAWRRDRAGLRALVIGDGSQRDRLRQLVADAGADDCVEFAGSLPHAAALARLRHAGIYVSVNKMGNLSNANLEAMRLGLCCIFPSGDTDTGRDLATDRLFPAGSSVYRVDLQRLDRELPEAIYALHRDVEARQARAAVTGALAAELIPSWEQRIAGERAILSELAGGQRGGQAARPPRQLKQPR